MNDSRPMRTAGASFARAEDGGDGDGDGAVDDNTTSSPTCDGRRVNQEGRSKEGDTAGGMLHDSQNWELLNSRASDPTTADSHATATASH